MDGLKSEESLILPPASELLRNSKDDDKMVVDEPCNEISRESKPLLPSVQALSTQADEYIRHRMSDMSVSSQRMDNKVLSPLEPSSQQVFNESLSLYYRRGSLVDPQSNSRRPSIAEMGNLPYPIRKWPVAEDLWSLRMILISHLGLHRLLH
ncbi:hypothetical protein EDC96DRAFT_549740 [Choanephora cucurbitarum]|nr:hypothetical protein EDC96DRAFT_549740 [Choanephora cucurbitarum]